jgi:hypothetical protein
VSIRGTAVSKVMMKEEHGGDSDQDNKGMLLNEMRIRLHNDQYSHQYSNNLSK